MLMSITRRSFLLGAGAAAAPLIAAQKAQERVVRHRRLLRHAHLQIVCG